jgi:hypothetical protein
MDLPFLREALILARVVLLPLEAISVMLNIVGPNEKGGSGFKGSEVLGIAPPLA